MQVAGGRAGLEELHPLQLTGARLVADYRAAGPLGAGAMFSGGTTVRARACCGGQIGASCSVYDEVDGVRLTDLPPPEVEDPGNTQWNRVPCRIRLEPVRSTPHWEDARPELAVWRMPATASSASK